MEVTFNIYDLITASVFILNIFVAGIFLVRNFKISLTHKFISFILLLLLIRTFSIHLFLSKEILNFPNFLFLSQLASRIALPIIFLMLVFEVNQRKFKWYDALHVLPVLFFLVNFWALYSKTATEKVAFINKMYKEGFESLWSEGTYLTDNAIFLLRVTLFCGYLIAMVIILFNRKKDIKLSNSLKDFFTAMLLYLFLNLISVVLSNVLYLFNENSVFETNTIDFITTFLLLGYFFFIPTFMYDPYFTREKEVKSVQKITQFKTATYNHLEKIEQYFNLHKSYLNPDYTITQLEREIKIPARQISKAIKLIRNQNFNQFLNEYRINYLVQHVSVETALKTNFQDLAFQVGFNSVNNFYAHFKNYVGCTPKTYYANLKKAAITSE
jgi:AraC-like DNA-binding protein